MLLRLRAGLSDLEDIRNFISRAANSIEVDESLISDLKLAVDEAVSNIIIYGYQGKSGDIEIELSTRGADLIITLRDHAPVFDMTAYQAQAAESPFSKKNPGGFGIILIRSMIDEMVHKVTDEGGNELSLIKRNAVVH